ncbi:MAG TPA: Hpt domain-containing protein [Rhizomicrobium sp.]|nr:Hpt domain-containing protein [Rhizomicrobium sp.]
MARQQPIELFMPPNMLKAKAGGGFGGVDLAAIKRAEGAMENLKAEFGNMAADGISALGAARDAYLAKADPASRGALLRAAHDLKGQAGTFGFPLMARVAGSLTKMLTEAPEGVVLPLKLVDAHVAAMTVIHRQNITGSEDKIALALIAELDSQVGQLLKAS